MIYQNKIITLKIKTMNTIIYKGIEITKTFVTSNYSGTLRFHAILPNGSKVSSPDKNNLKKRIKKYFNENI